MKNVLIVNPHSFIDVITNSSTELFVCGKDKSKEQIIKILKKFKIYDVVDVFEYTTERHLQTKHQQWDYQNEGNIGKIIVKEKTDNAIYYKTKDFDILDELEWALNAKHEHLG